MTDGWGGYLVAMSDTATVGAWDAMMAVVMAALRGQRRAVDWVSLMVDGLVDSTGYHWAVGMAVLLDFSRVLRQVASKVVLMAASKVVLSVATMATTSAGKLGKKSDNWSAALRAQLKGFLWDRRRAGVSVENLAATKELSRVLQWVEMTGELTADQLGSKKAVWRVGLTASRLAEW